MSTVVRFRSVLVLSFVAVLAALLPLGVANAGSSKHFSQVYTCGSSNDEDHLGSATELEARINLGHWTHPSSAGHPCAGGTKFVPSATGITFTFRWYAGSTLLRKDAGKTELHPGGRVDYLKQNLVSPAVDGHWQLHGKAVTLRVTIAKSGYATKIVTLKWFPGQ
ncbi:MAG: hypothetical protein JWP74_894 [Marmoricola sp.]|nr:hypothetical protein [Marmoricola sp.]